MSTLEVIVIALGASLGLWGGVNFMEGYSWTMLHQNGHGP
ncbi:MAG: Maff2 family protein [Ethanoligenens sp.]